MIPEIDDMINQLIRLQKEESELIEEGMSGELMRLYLEINDKNSSLTSQLVREIIG